MLVPAFDRWAIALFAASLALIATGVDPLQLTMISVALTVMVMPAVVLPFPVLMNDPACVKDHVNGPVANSVLATLTIAGRVDL